MKTHLALFLTIVWFSLVSYGQTTSAGLSISQESSMQHELKTIGLFKLANKNGMSIRVTNYAATLTDISVPDSQGHAESVVLGFDSLASYLGRHPKLGATIGRFANRIKNAEFCLNNQIYHLEKNSKGHSIHGGTKGFNVQVFRTDTFYIVKDTAVIVFTYRSAHLEGGFPGNLNLSVAYKLTNQNEVIVEYTATTDKPTVVNLTNHSYFNLTGCKESVLNHIYKIQADSITPVDSTGIPTGAFMSVAGTEYDYTAPQTVEKQLRKSGKGYDINYKLNKEPGSLELAAVVVEPVSGRVLKAYTTEPGMQFYIPNSKMDYLVGHNHNTYGSLYGFCLEMQHFPDSPNQPQFPTTVLLPEETYRQITLYKFENTKEMD